MVKLFNVSMKEFVKLIGQKDIICFGAGHHLKQFMTQNSNIRPLFVVDNYIYLDIKTIDINGMNIPVWSPDSLSQINLCNSIIVITAAALEDIIDQLDQIGNLDGILCFFALALNDYKEVEPEQKKIYLNQMKYLVNRTNKDVLKRNYALYNIGAKQKKFQVWEKRSVAHTAASKARYDVKDIAGRLGYEVIKIHSSRGEAGTSIRRCSDKLVKDDWVRFLNNIPGRSIVLIQSPEFYDVKLVEDVYFQMKDKKSIRFIYFIHDLENLRFASDYNNELAYMKETGDFFIVHNDIMKKYLIGYGFDAPKIRSLHIFDYLGNGEIYNKAQFEKSITIAANLSLRKSPYLLELKELKHTKFNLYGPNFSKEIAENSELIKYHGTVVAEELPKILNKGFGLIWDGNSIETCSGLTGQYLKYNNPHKLSLYLSAGIPVIIWSGAAAAEFVKKNHVGLVVDSLYELEDILQKINEEQYYNLAENTKRIAVCLNKGEYTQNSIKQAEEILGC